jgi:hypothetical protein
LLYMNGQSGVVVTAAAIGAGVSSVFTLLLGFLDRRARRKELIFQAALEMGRRRADVAMQVSRETGTPLQLEDDVTLAEMYHAELKSLFHHGRLTPEAHKRREASMDRLRASGVPLPPDQE